MIGLSKVLFVALLLFLLVSQVTSDAYDHRYSIGDTVPIYANKVGVHSIHWERYNYYDFPFCSPDSVKEKDNLGKMLTGESLLSTPFMVGFRVDKELELLCKKRLNKSDVSLFDRERLPHTIHSNFGISYNKDRVIGVTLEYDQNSVVDVTYEMEMDVDFTYSIKWWETNSSFDERLNGYITAAILPHHTYAHVYSITNSCFTIFIMIICLVIFYIRFLHKDISRYACDVEEAEVNNSQEQKGWKNIHGDVFRFPKHKSLLSAALGSGTQLLVLMVVILILGIMGVFQPNFQLVTFKALVAVYVVASVVSGYTSASFYHQLLGTTWIKNILLTGGLYFGPFLLTFSLNITFAVYSDKIDAFPLDTIIKLSLVWIFLAFPLLILGAIVGKNNASDFRSPCRIAKCCKAVPRLVWYRRILPQMILAGFLPFCVIKIQLYDNLFTVWGFGFYTFYNSMAIMFVLLLIMTSLVSVMLTSFQLAVEDHEWWWRSFLNGGSTGLYMYGYSIFFYISHPHRDSFVEAFCFFGYMACLGYAMFLVLGTVGFRASLLFVRYLYASIKCD